MARDCPAVLPCVPSTSQLRRYARKSRKTRPPISGAPGKEVPVKSYWKKRRRHDFRGVTRSVRTAAVNSRCSRQKFECSSLNCNLMAPPRRPPISKQTADCFPCLSGDAMKAISLRSVSTTLAALVLSCSTSLAQIAPLTVISPAMGATSPLGIPGALTGVTSPVGPVGIPLGASELSPGGLSPAPFDPTASTNSCSSVRERFQFDIRRRRREHQHDGFL